MCHFCKKKKVYLKDRLWIVMTIQVIDDNKMSTKHSKRLF